MSQQVTQNFHEAQSLLALKHFHLCTHFRNSVLIYYILLSGIPFSVNLWVVPGKYNSYSVDDLCHFLTFVNYPSVLIFSRNTYSKCASFQCWEGIHSSPRGCCHIISTWMMFTLDLSSSASACVSSCAEAEKVLRLHKGNLSFLAEDILEPFCLDYRNARHSFLHLSFMTVVDLGMPW